MLDSQGRKLIYIPKTEYWNSKTEMFEYRPEINLILEHSLFSIARWESKWKIPFLSENNKTNEQMIDYIRIMTVNEVDPSVYNYLPIATINEISEFMNDSMTATFFSDAGKQVHDRRIVTAELIYYWMLSLGIPFECEHWHIQRLMTLIKVCNEEGKVRGNTKKKFDSSDLAQRRALNKLRQQQRKGK